jgi:hypothetical protein
MERAGEWDSLKKQMNEKHEKDVKELREKLTSKDGEIKVVKNSMEHYLVRAEATAAISGLKGEPVLLLPTVQKFTRVVEENGEIAIQVVDSKGAARVDGKGNPLTISDLVAELKTDPVFGRAFESSGNSGSGMRPNGGSGGSGSSITKRGDLKTERERSAFINEYGLEAYQALPLF